MFGFWFPGKMLLKEKIYTIRYLRIISEALTVRVIAHFQIQKVVVILISRPFIFLNLAFLFRFLT